MEEVKSRKDRVREYWEGRADLLERAGTNDVIAKKLEIEALARHISDGMHILEVGCGNGVTAIELARRFEVFVDGFDFSKNMVESARKLSMSEQLKGAVSFEVADIRSLPDLGKKYDVVITERVLINLDDWSAQARAIEDLSRYLNDGGRYLMCENSQDGLDEINEMRSLIGLGEITPPWHNRYLREDEVNSLRIPGLELVRIECFSATYYFLSRVVNAYLAALDGLEPSYDAPVNRLALFLPPIGCFGQGKLWVWQKRSGRD